MPDPSDPAATVFVQNADGTEFYQLGPAFATGEVFNSDAQADIISGGWGVRVTLRGGANGADLWNSGAARCFAKDSSCPSGRMAIVLDGVVQSAPSVNQPSFSGGVDITGSFTEGEAKDLARVLKSGALPVRLQVQAVQTVAPTLGNDSLRAAIISGLIGVGLVLLFMLLYYRSLAAVVVVGLLVSGTIQWNVISLLSRTNGLALSLAGIAGIIVSIGVTVDSYVVFFEKLKDEVKAGRTLRNSAERGFKSAWRTILAADIVSLLGAFTLWYLTVGSVRGFAFFLGLSTLCDLIVAWFFTRPTMLLLARSNFIARRRVFGVDPSVLRSAALRLHLFRSSHRGHVGLPGDLGSQPRHRLRGWCRLAGPRIVHLRFRCGAGRRRGQRSRGHERQGADSRERRRRIDPDSGRRSVHRGPFDGPIGLGRGRRSRRLRGVGQLRQFVLGPKHHREGRPGSRRVPDPGVAVHRLALRMADGHRRHRGDAPRRSHQRGHLFRVRIRGHNQVLMRSLNTSLAAVLPVISLLVLGSGVFGAVALREFAVALLVGLLIGSYSSIFVASPLLAVLKEREPRFRNLRGLHSTGAELEHMVVTGTSIGLKSVRRQTQVDPESTPSAPVTSSTLLTHPPRPRKKRRR